jgi:hypothetical protein
LTRVIIELEHNKLWVTRNIELEKLMQTLGTENIDYSGVMIIFDGIKMNDASSRWGLLEPQRQCPQLD